FYLTRNFKALIVCKKARQITREVFSLHLKKKLISLHLKLRFQTERPPPPQIIHQDLLLAAEERGEYF
ncbi:MAG: hypothetical protein MUP98_12595, partial [Candidatus Aminicenantes bacterium]|nr:hypothetical protein [Candidatus Aminicenantes bacterium]